MRDASFKSESRGTDLPGVEIAGLGLGMIVLSVVLLVWAFPRVPHR
jgi:hypothetical protein